MATFLSNPHSSGSRATPGERRLADRFRDLLEDDYLCWYDVPIGPKHQHPDFERQRKASISLALTSMAKAGDIEIVKQGRGRETTVYRTPEGK